VPIRLQPVTTAQVREFITWRYDAPYDGYNIVGDEAELVTYFTSDAVNCHALLDNEELIGFCTFGSDAQVPGGDYFQNRLDIGLGIRPDLTGQGNGTRYVAAVVEFASRRGMPLRATIAAVNERAIKVWESNGFQQTQDFEAESEVMGTRRFGIYERD